MRLSLKRLGAGVLAVSMQLTVSGAVAGGAAVATAAAAHATANRAVPEGPAPTISLAPGAGTDTTPPAGNFDWPRKSPHPAELAAAKQAAGAVAAATPPTAPAGFPASGQPRGTQVATTLSANGIMSADQGNNVTPPDTTGAIGPTRYVEAVNNLVRVYDRSLAPISSLIPLYSLFGFGASCRTTDPQFEYDPVASRWYYAGLIIGQAGCLAAGANSFARVFGWSNSTDPTPNLSGAGGTGTNWCKFSINDGALVFDFPKLGHSDGWLAIGTNVFNSSDVFLGADLTTISKPANGDTSCASPTLHDFFNLQNTADSTPSFTPIPANTVVSSTFLWVVAAHRPHGPSPFHADHVMTWYVNGAGTLITSTDLAVNIYYFAPDAPQPGTSTYTLDTSDTRLTQAVANVDPSLGGSPLAIWTQHAVIDPNLPMAWSDERWYEITVSGTTTSVAQQGNVGMSGQYVFNGAISPTTAGGDAVIDFNFVLVNTGGISLPYVGAEGRRSITPQNLMGGFVVLASSTNIDTDFSCGISDNPPCRWGDYAGATPDPADNNVVWGSSQWDGSASGGLAQWNTVNFELTPISGGNYTPVPPARILDTRIGLGAPQAKIGPGAHIDVLVAGAPGSGIPASGVAAVVINITATAGTQDSYFAAYPTGTPTPLASNINFKAFQDIANLAIVTIGTGGMVSLYNSQGSADAVFDVQGWFSTTALTAGQATTGLFVPLAAPNRIMDTRSGLGGFMTPFPLDTTRNLQVTGSPGVPANASAVVLNMTAVEGSSPSYLTAFPAGGSRPTASNVNFPAHRNLPNRVIVQLSAGGAISIYNNLGNVDVVVDVDAYITDGTLPTDTGLLYYALAPFRVLDTRVGVGGLTRFGPNSINVATIPYFAPAAVLNVTQTSATAGSYFTIYPTDVARPTASDLNFGPGDTIANLTLVRLAPNGTIGIYNNAGSVDAIADQSGWFG